MPSYFSYRIMLSEPANIIPFPPSKEERFKNVFESLIEHKKEEFVDWGTKQVIAHYKKLGNKIYIWQFAKEHDFEKAVIGENKIETVGDTEYPFIYLIFHVEYQMVLIEYNSSIYPQVDSVKSKLQRHFTKKLEEGRITVNVSELSDKKEMWEQIQDWDMVQEVSLDYNPPNFFRGEKQVDKLVKDVHEETNFRKFRIYIGNTIEGISFTAASFREHISRLAAGAGGFVIKGLKGGVDAVIKHFDLPIKETIDNIDVQTEESLEKQFDDIKQKTEEGDA